MKTSWMPIGYRIALLLGGVWAIGLGACDKHQAPAASDSAGRPSSTLTGAVAPPTGAPSLICNGPEGPCAIDNLCGGVWLAGPLPAPWWSSAAPAACLPSVSHEPLQWYDDCTNDVLAASPQGCNAPKVGAIVCEVNVWSQVGRRTQSCQKPGDCPPGMLCVLDGVPVDEVPSTSWAGVCEKACSGQGGAAACLRCDLECDVQHGVCRPKRPPEAPKQTCTADCECKGAVCQDGVCRDDLGRPYMGICGPGGDCPCNGGTCDQRGCCILPDGTIAQVYSPACAKQ